MPHGKRPRNEMSSDTRRVKPRYDETGPLDTWVEQLMALDEALRQKPKGKERIQKIVNEFQKLLVEPFILDVYTLWEVGQQDVGQKIAYQIYNLGQLSTDLVPNSISFEAISFLLYRLREQRVITAKAIANGLHGLGQLTKNKSIHGCMSAESIRGLLQALLKKLLTCRDVDAQGIANALNGIGYMAKEGKLSDKIDSDLLQALLKKLLTCPDE